MTEPSSMNPTIPLAALSVAGCSYQNSPQPSSAEITSSVVSLHNPLVSPSTCAPSVRMPTPEPYDPQKQPVPTRLSKLSKPAIPAEMQRYERKIKISKVYYTQEIESGKLQYIEPAITGWDRLVHPEGAPYFHKQIPGTERHVFTDTDLSVPQHLYEVEKFIKDLFEAAERLPTPISPQTVLVLELKFDHVPTRRKQQCIYYFVDHSRKSIFWVHKRKISEICANIKGVKSEGHLKYAIETHYWFGVVGAVKSDDRRLTQHFPNRNHLELYPDDQVVKEEFFVELRQTLIHANADSILSDTSLAPFESGDLQRLLELISNIQDSVGKRHAHSMSVLARVMLHTKFLNFCGQVGARLDADQSVFTKKIAKDEPVSLFMKLLDLALLGAPTAHLRGVRSIWVDKTINESRWKIYISRLNTEWNGFTIYSTVMLAVDISFLAVPGVQSTNGDQSGATISIYASVITSVSALIISVLLAGQIRRLDVDSVEGGATYMDRMTKSVFGMEALAVMFSLPYSLLLWGMFFFILALSFLVFQTNDHVTLATMIPSWIVVVLMTLWPLWWGTISSLPLAMPSAGLSRKRTQANNNA
ncbi:hypothetical protein HYDPIDRAFT_30226 [Hydnomerulius pinastri MD-312]|uniref:Unplaced genomic scaffold scaffold_20, whole genome shotgun sequence n=1 Tax=Hydnomerulius pinastri MD-312 TaxID=994086 RepID=A0A0C9VWS4_9AGAM|nr:hypothetical protein HYDPIDRAFT_30226 [Hydnomerulius pinastri MD-312]